MYTMMAGAEWVYRVLLLATSKRLCSTIELFSRGASSWIRTRDTRLNRASLYQTELRKHVEMVGMTGFEPATT